MAGGVEEHRVWDATSGRIHKERANLLGLFADECRMHIWDYTTGSNRGLAETLVEFLIVLDSQLNVTRGDAVLLVVLGGVASELQKLGRQILKDGRHVDRSASTDTTGEAALLQVARKTSDGEGEASLGGAALGARGLLHGLLGSFTGHD